MAALAMDCLESQVEEERRLQLPVRLQEWGFLILGCMGIVPDWNSSDSAVKQEDETAYDNRYS